jgi:hypothetical protein
MNNPFAWSTMPTRAKATLEEEQRQEVRPALSPPASAAHRMTALLIGAGSRGVATRKRGGDKRRCVRTRAAGRQWRSAAARAGSGLNAGGKVIDTHFLICCKRRMARGHVNVRGRGVAVANE